jgi:hypothetical protein
MEYELTHWGIKGQKWGVRRYQNADGSLTSLGRSRQKNTTLYGKAKPEKKSERDHSDSNKSEVAMLLANMAIDVASLNVVGLGLDAGRLVSAGKSRVMTSLYNKDRKDCKTDKKTGFLLKKKEFTNKEDAARVNPEVRNFDSNTKNNCMLCTCAYDLRRRGYEVRANKASYGYNENDVKAWYPKAKLQKVSGEGKRGVLSNEANKDMISKLKNELVKQGNGARGNIMVQWRTSFGGHSMAYEVSEGKVRIIDAQVNKIYDDPDKILRRCQSNVTYARLDNVDFNLKNIKEVAK